MDLETRSLPASLAHLLCMRLPTSLLFTLFFFHDTPTTQIYTLSLHDALPISTPPAGLLAATCRFTCLPWCGRKVMSKADRKSTRLNSSHGYISYAVFCLKKKKNRRHRPPGPPPRSATATATWPSLRVPLRGQP